MRHDMLSDVLTIIRNAESVGKAWCVVPSSKLVKDVLKIMKLNDYIKKFAIDDNKYGEIKIELKGKINNCKAIKPRFSVKKDEYEKFEKRFLPSKDFGILIVSTSEGVMSHKRAKEKKLGGKLLAFIY